MIFWLHMAGGKLKSQKKIQLRKRKSKGTLRVMINPTQGEVIICEFAVLKKTKGPGQKKKARKGR